MISKKKNGIMIYTVSPYISEQQALELIGTFSKNANNYFIIDHDADVFDEDGKLILRFRKNVLTKSKLDIAYDNLISFAKAKSNNRGTPSGTEVGLRNPETNKSIASNIMGYFDMWTIGHNYMFKILKIPPPFNVRVCAFNEKFPEKWDNVIPLIKEIDRMYQKLIPANHKLQLAYATQTAYHIKGTSFTTVTTNKNLQTAFHIDAGDCTEGFGNLVVIERGKYSGAFTIFPRYKIGVDVRTGDFLAMDVHQVHGNTPIKLESVDATRLSLVCYLRQNVYNKSKGSSDVDVKKNVETMSKLKKRFDIIKKKMIK